MCATVAFREPSVSEPTPGGRLPQKLRQPSFPSNVLAAHLLRRRSPPLAQASVVVQDDAYRVLCERVGCRCMGQPRAGPSPCGSAQSNAVWRRILRRAKRKFSNLISLRTKIGKLAKADGVPLWLHNGG